MAHSVVSSKLTKKYQATIPEPVRKVLGLAPGDSVAFDINEESEKVILRKATVLDTHFARAVEETLASEWLSKYDEQAYHGL